MKFRKLHLTIFPVAMLAVYLSMSSYSGGISGRTTTGCTCHGTANTNTVVTVSGPSSYSNNQVITFTVNVSNATLAGAGFDLKCNIGQITSVDAGITKVNNTEITQNAAKTITGGVASWTFQWTAPATGSTALQFAVVGNAVNLNGSTSGDAWNFATIASIPLPIEFESFKIVADKQSINVLWKMADQKNTDHFEIEKSTDGLNFNLLSQIATNKNDDKSDYKFEDMAVMLHQTYFYRIKEVMTDGTSTYTQIQSATFADDKNRLQLYPNAFSGNQFYIKGIDFSGAINTLQIVSVSGKVLFQITINGSAVQLPAHITAGSYIARIIADNKLIYSGFIFKK
jgi:hypothetical protein